MFELIATLYLCLKKAEHVDMGIKKEKYCLTSIPKEETLAAMLGLYK
jgi:hypothetical protein